MAAIDLSFTPDPAHTPEDRQDHEWTALAACVGQLHLFFGPRAERPHARERRERQARALCDRCPVLAQCRQEARASREYGYWGGESEEERHRAGFTVAAPIGIRSRFSQVR